jgi:hypothetical protein
MSRSYIDKYAEIGRPYLAPESETTIDAQPSSRSLKELSKFDKQARMIRAEVKRGELRLDLSHVIGDRIKINKRNAVKFANWILNTYGLPKAANRRISKEIRASNK